jgi:hypothetical protein
MAITIGSDPYHRPRRTALITVHLACKCTTKTRVVPFHGAKFGCGSGLGHGYQVDWVQAEQPNGITIINRKMRGEK